MALSSDVKKNICVVSAFAWVW